MKQKNELDIYTPAVQVLLRFFTFPLSTNFLAEKCTIRYIRQRPRFLSTGMTFVCFNKFSVFRASQIRPKNEGINSYTLTR